MTGPPEAMARGPDEIAAITKDLRRRFPGVFLWYGVHTSHWWAAVFWGRSGRLVEATTPEGLAWELGKIFRCSPDR
ncbi:hypothetical protein GCM10010191_90670 [Actinomadura vinacea]|uniref:Uncharacterized protein n=1 Tax=Actinomadura vinacea TaxID=115336 RepID=A0ABN3KE23_9ACTN